MYVLYVNLRGYSEHFDIRNYFSSPKIVPYKQVLLFIYEFT